MEQTTAWGAPSHDVRRAAASLRALASRHHVELTAVEEVAVVDLVAAVAAAELLCRAAGVTSLEELASPARGTRPVLARLLLRAAGHAEATDPADVDPRDVPLELAAHVDAVVAWADDQLPGHASLVARAMVADLADERCAVSSTVAHCLASMP